MDERSHLAAKLRSILLLGALLLTPLAIVAPAANAAGRAWPGTRITYYDASLDKVAVARAVAAWNSSGIRTRFVRTYRRGSAQLVIRNSRSTPGGCGTGRATLGYSPHFQAFLDITSTRFPTDQGCSVYGQTLVVTHELGHVLGFEHDDGRCSIMNSSHVDGVAPYRCYYAGVTPATYDLRTATWRCRLLEPIDVRRAVARYRGAYRPVRFDPWCDLYTKVAAPAVTSTWNASLRAIELHVTRPAARPIAGFLKEQATFRGGVEVRRAAPGACHATLASAPEGDTESNTNFQWGTDVDPGEEQTFDFQDVTPGSSYCYSVWARDTLDKLGAGPTTITVTVPPDEFAPPAVRHRSRRSVEPSATVEPRTPAIPVAFDVG
ncbi:MAG: hypothetical protein JWM86_2522 [Thermoleophilia bacterium]|nr:hypothetical protein [Thermoleophilia bacterium]